MACASRLLEWRSPPSFASSCGGRGGRPTTPRRSAAMTNARRIDMSITTPGPSSGSAIRSSADRPSIRSPSISTSPETYARAKPSWLGDHNIRRKPRGLVNVSCTGASGGPSSLPSQHRTRTGASAPRPARTNGPTKSTTLTGHPADSATAISNNCPPDRQLAHGFGHSCAAYPARVNRNRNVSDEPGNLPHDSGDQRREIVRLAVPAFLALVAEPLFLLADSAIIGHLGTTQLAGLGVASAALITAANVFVFLAYGTTSIVARQVGAGSQRAAVSAGVDGLW